MIFRVDINNIMLTVFAELLPFLCFTTVSCLDNACFGLTCRFKNHFLRASLSNHNIL